ncbi:MAG: hypothetical protein EB084_10480, partial [Proteobacteria bacterium]|nr:hypothetical protein [Pseudomonadota bacterium]
APPSPPLSDLRVVSLGDSLTQGTQDGNNSLARMKKGYISQFADQAGLTFNQPLFDGNGIPAKVFDNNQFSAGLAAAQTVALDLAAGPLSLYSYFLGPPSFILPSWNLIPKFGHRLPETRNTAEHPQSNFAVYGFQTRHLDGVSRIQDYLEEVHQGLQSVSDGAFMAPLIRATLGNGKNSGEGSQVDQALKQNPDLVTLWTGSNDALEAIFTGRIDDRILTPVDDRPWTYSVRNPITGRAHDVTTPDVRPGFRSQMTALVDKIVKGSQAEVMLFNVPNVTSIASARELGKPLGKLPFRVQLVDGTDVTSELERWVIPSTIKGPGLNGRTEFPPGSYVDLGTILEKLVVGGLPLNVEELRARMAPDANGVPKGWLSEDEALDPAEIQAVQSQIDAFNKVIDDIVIANPRVHLVDIHRVLDDGYHNGRLLRGAGPDEWVVPGFTGAPDAQGRDGIFSYDGVHPSDTGHAVIANVLLEAVQRDLGSNPKFARFMNVPYIDEKQVHRQDPHTRTRSRARPTLVLTPVALKALSRTRGF